MASALPWAASALGGIFSGIGRSKPQSQTSTSNSTSTSEAVLGGKQKKINKAIFQQLLDLIKQGPTVSQADRNTMRSQTNQAYNSANTNLEANLAARGYASGGKLGAGIRDNSLERAKATQSGEAGLTRDAWSKFMQAIGAGFQFDQPRETTTTSQGTQTSTGSGVPWQSTVGSGFGDLSSMLFAKNMGLFGGGGGSSLPIAGPSNMSDLWKLQPGYGCKVAAELYGPLDWRFFVARAEVFKLARKKRRYAFIVWLYVITGPVLAFVVRKNRTARGMAERIFSGILRGALNHQ